MSVLEYDPQAFQDFQVLATRMCCLAARVYSFWEVHLSRQSGQDRLVETY